ncbi:MAG: XdhC family protein [Candidatus Hodarchaeota archaeon]
MKEFIKILKEQSDKGNPLVLVTVIEVQGSAPQKVGAKMLVSNEGRRLWGTIGGGTIENLALQQAKIQIKEQKPLLKHYELKEEGKDSTGMLCGGNMSLFYDILGNITKVYILGGGHISQKLVPILIMLGFWIVIIDDREEYIHESFKNIKGVELLSGPLPQYLDTIEFESESYVIIVTYSHELDENILRYLLTKKSRNILQLKYLGMIGSKRKVKEIFSRLKAQGVCISQLEKVHAPIGVPIGSQTPEEIAVSIAAELIKVRNVEE